MSFSDEIDQYLWASSADMFQRLVDRYNSYSKYDEYFGHPAYDWVFTLKSSTYNSLLRIHDKYPRYLKIPDEIQEDYKKWVAMSFSKKV